MTFDGVLLIAVLLLEVALLQNFPLLNRGRSLEEDKEGNQNTGLTNPSSQMATSL